MPDPRITKLAKVLVHYSLQIQPGQLVYLQTTPLADELSLAFFEEATKAGAHIHIQNEVPGTREIFLKNASDEQLDFENPIRRKIYETFDARMVIEADSNTRDLGPKADRSPKEGQWLALQVVRRPPDQRRYEVVSHRLPDRCCGARSQYESERLPRIRVRSWDAQRR